MAGHADISVTLNTYSHYWKEAAQKAANIFSTIPSLTESIHWGIHSPRINRDNKEYNNDEKPHKY